MNTPMHTPGGYVGGSGVFPPAKAPVYPWMCLPIDQDTLAFGNSPPESAAAAAAGSPTSEVEKKPDISGKSPSSSMSPPPPPPPMSSTSVKKARGLPTLTLVPSPSAEDKIEEEPSSSPGTGAAPDVEMKEDENATTSNNGRPVSPNSKEYLFTEPVKKSPRPHGSDTESDEEGEGCSFSDDDEDGNNQIGYYYAPPRNRREPQTAGGTDRSLSAITNCPISIAWLKANFEYAPGKSLPRGFVYDQYVVLCEEHTLEPVNAASFGKLIRCVFPGLKTRRLGTRGNSKYHYNGVYLKKESVLHALLNHVKTQQGLTYDATGKRGRKMKGPKTWHAAGQPKQKVERIIEPQELTLEEYMGKMPSMDKPFAEINLDPNVELPSGVTPENLSTFQFMYHEHCKVLVTCFSKLNLKGVEQEWSRFWRLTEEYQKVKMEFPPTNFSVNYEAIMPWETLRKVCSVEATQMYIKTMDLWTYQLILDILFPCAADVMPLKMLQSLEKFFGSCIRFLSLCVQGYSCKLGLTKADALTAFHVWWSEKNALNRMVKTVATSLRHEDSLKAMRSELGRALNFNKIDMDLLKVLAPSGFALVLECILDFKKRLEDTQDQTIGAWLTWIESLVMMLHAECHRQVQEQEAIRKPNPVKFWKMASDKILGAVMRGTAVSSGVFRTLLLFCDGFVAYFHDTFCARMGGYDYHLFYVYNNMFSEVNLRELENMSEMSIQKEIADTHDVEMTDVEKQSPADPSTTVTTVSSPNPDIQTSPKNEPKLDSQKSETQPNSQVKSEEEESPVENEAEEVIDEEEGTVTEILGLPIEVDDGDSSAASIENELIIQEVAQCNNEEDTEDRYPTAAELGLRGYPDEDRRVVVTLNSVDEDGPNTQDIILDYEMLFDPVTAEFLADHNVCKSKVRRAY